ncbi:MAG: cation diffusion facilitator family transporter [Raineya sp.]|nr:cation diffusion facilitator family transporter [Raineya sp.]MDW8296015.1 cation diffusion facilitator family transporter [Raineya sp.]
MKQRLILLSFLVSILLMFIKFTAYFLTNSTAILTDALESIINVVASGFAFYSVYLSSLPRDFEHPYGHGKIEFFSAGFEGSLIITAGLVIVWQAIMGFLYPKPLEKLDVGLYLVAFSTVINGVVGLTLQKYGKKYDSLTLIADGKHLFSDAVSSLLLIVGVGIIIFTKQEWLDSVISLVFAFLLLKEGYFLVRKSIAGLMDELNPHSVQEVLDILVKNRQPNWIDVHNLRVQHYGANWHIDCHLTLPYYLDLRQTHDEVERFRDFITTYTGKEVEIFIHADPCMPPENCEACNFQDCPVRQLPFVKSPEWTIENLVKDAKHFRKI